MAKNVRTIPATISRFTATPLTAKEKRKVAAYARVSTDHEEQQSSYEAQVDYYTNYIKGRDDWEFAGLYSDEGISATNTKHRDGFNSMVQDALAGKIDLIITKSVSRFARNTVDSLSTIRKLKENGCECYFEKENIWTFDAKGELLITIMSSLAQEESRSISENTTWGQRKRFADGKVTVPFGRFLGYDRGPDGNLVVNKEQAKTVQLIYKLFLDGYSCGKVAKKLTGLGIPTPGGKKNWSSSTVRSILTNEKYKGDALLQKVYTADFLTKEKKKNNGEVPQYYVEKNHEAIIDPRVFEQVQAEMERRTNSEGRYSGTGIFASKIKCGDCSGWFGSKVWHSNDKYRRVIYQCNHKFKNGSKCQTPHLTEDEIKAVFVKAVNQYLSERDALMANAETILHLLSDTAELEKRLDESAVKMNALVEQTENIVAENARVVLDQTAYNERYDSLISQYEEEKAIYDKLESEIADKKARHQQLQDFIIAVKETAQFQTEFDKGLWCALVDFLTVKSKDEITVTFRDGTEITVE